MNSSVFLEPKNLDHELPRKGKDNETSLKWENEQENARRGNEQMMARGLLTSKRSPY